MIKTQSIKTVTFLLVIPNFRVFPLSPNHQPEENQKDRKKKTRGLCAPGCGCLWGTLCGLTLAAMLAAAIAVPFVISSLAEENQTTIRTSILSTMTTTSSTSTTTTTDIPCSVSCTSQQTCVRGICVGIGSLSCTLTWSRTGDGDLVLTTPNNNTISYTNMGPNAGTDQGQLDVDDKVGTGPENIFWSNNSTAPPMGVYHICFSQFSFTPPASLLNPITATITIVRSSNTTMTVTRTFTSVVINSTVCTASSSHLLTSFSYP